MNPEAEPSGSLAAVTGLRLPDGFPGRTAGPAVHEVDARWVMAYAAGVGATETVYLDTARPGGILAHPLFPVSYEWAVALALRAGLGPEVASRSVHLGHDLCLHRLPRPGDRLATTGRIVAVAPHRAGTLVTTRFETVDGAGAPVSTTRSTSLYRGVGGEGAGGARASGVAAGITGGPGPPAEAAPASAGSSAAERPPAEASPPGEGSGPVGSRWMASVSVGAGLAHVYTECARIWNPIHTDRAVAVAAGLPGLVLHGTATLTLLVSEVVRREAGGDPRRVRRVAGRFGAPVGVPSTLVLQGQGALDAPEGRWVAAAALTVDGQPAVRGARVLVVPA